jgi:hypothetical protein
MPWTTFDPFLFCVHHLDFYPRGNAVMAPDASLAGRNLGMDFGGKDGWSMYHGEVVPGFPRHPHRGFETITVARRGFIDHSDSLGATARFGEGDTQWMTAGRGIVHSEMFPLLSTEHDNPTELFQIWLNLPRTSKMVEPHFSMLWSNTTPRARFEDDAGRSTSVHVIAGRLAEHAPPPPPPDSWASRPEAAIAIWSIDMEAQARFTLPAGPSNANRTIYFFDGPGLHIGDLHLTEPRGVRLQPDVEVELAAGPGRTQVLLLQGKPLDEPTVQYGPFVMNAPEEIQQAIVDYRRTQFGGWPWPDDAPVHPRDAGRFARHADGNEDRPDS